MSSASFAARKPWVVWSNDCSAPWLPTLGGGRHDISLEFVVEALRVLTDIAPEWISVHSCRPEDFLVVFARLEHMNRVSGRPSMTHKGVNLFFGQWNRQAQAVHATMRFRVELVLEGIPPHAWDREVAKDLLGSSCLVDMVGPETNSRRDLSAFKLSAWTANPEAIPTLRWLAVPEPGLVALLHEPSTQQYKVLIHLDAVMEFDAGEEPWFLGASSGSGQSGMPDSSDGSFGEGPGGGRSSHTQIPEWHFGHRDRHGTSEGSMAGVSHGAASSPAMLGGDL